MRILLVEDHQTLAEAIATALKQAGFAVDHASDGAEADHVLLTQSYQLVVLDLALPRLDGWEVLRRLRNRRNRVPVLILTAHGAIEDRVRGLDLGADDYLAKPFELAELEARARALIRRAHGLEQAQLAYGPLGYDTLGRLFTLKGCPLALTPREHSVLELLMLRAGRAVAKETLTDQVFGMESGSAEAIEIYVHRLRRKLADAEIGIVTLRGIGYMLEAQTAA
ncbi:MAG TPA: response regulator [Chitinolyticbacter sp.]|uniref:response regulator n=1 Tax=Chitinolyticbacter albus TaxID=2961951 RepID=UPI00210BF53E|nr:response regulator [Chitinolyticbacter albus]HSC78838.1 response regulator [Chitinolyticbacter sp.]